MGELLKQLRKDNMMAMKEHDTVKKGVLGMVISAVALAEKEKGVEEIFTPHPTSYNSSGDSANVGRPSGSTSNGNSVDESKMEYDQNYNQSVRSTWERWWEINNGTRKLYIK